MYPRLFVFTICLSSLLAATLNKSQGIRAELNKWGNMAETTWTVSSVHYISTCGKGRLEITSSVSVHCWSVYLS